MHRILSILSFLFFLSIYSYSQYISGYAEEIAGETLLYESHQPDANYSLLVRSEREEKFIEWKTSPVPENTTGSFAEFILLAGIDVNAEDNHEFKLFINDQFQFSFRNPVDTLAKTWTKNNKSGVSLNFKSVMVDKYGDLFGYIFLAIPKSIYIPGKSLKIKVSGESAKSRSWFMVFKYNATQKVKFIQEKAIVKNGNKQNQLVRIDILHFDKPVEASIKIGNIIEPILLKLGFNMHRINVPVVSEQTKTQVSISIDEIIITEDIITLSPVGKKIIYLLPHSHVDIGYTHVQDEVEQIQWQNIKDAIRFSKETKNYPNSAQFKWNSEVMWAVDSYLKSCTDVERRELKKAIQEGWFELNGIYANILTGLCRPEELFYMMKSGQEIGKEFDVDVNSAMISDIPGYSWGIVPVMAQSGIKYFSIGTNQGHRIGSVLEKWSDKPFYWQSPSGEEKILCWVHGKGYSAFHTGLAYTILRNKLKEQLIFDYLTELDQTYYPYDIVTLRYNIGSDNGPPDSYLPEIVRSWNEKYVSPKLIISTVGESFAIFEEIYGEQLPTYTGDFTGYWEDGAGSSAKETSQNRLAAERLTQTEKFFSLYQPYSYPKEKFNDAWENVLLYSEHTWGSWNSISEPKSDFTLQQWEIKKSFAKNSDSLSYDLLNMALPTSEAETVTSVDIYNSNSWIVTNLVTLPKNLNLKGDIIKDNNGKTILSQRISTGELVFVAKEVPAFGAIRLSISKNQKNHNNGDETNDNFFLHNHVNIEFDENNGAIKRLEFRDYPFNFVSIDSLHGINEYFYVSGRNPKNLFTINEVKIKIIENGPVLKTIEVESIAKGCSNLKSQITVINGLDRLDIKNILVKEDTLEPEGVHFGFPFNVPDGKVRISNAWGYYEAENEQLPAANKNYFTANRWADVSNENYGITFIPIDAPLIELGEITTDPIDFGWIDSSHQTQTIYSYVMNNYWETNYKASQPGEVEFRYCLYPHLEFNPLQAERWAIEQLQPLIPAASDHIMEIKEAPFSFDNKNIIIETMKPMGDQSVLIRLYNPGKNDEIVNIEKKDVSFELYNCDPFGNEPELIKNEIKIPSRGMKSILIK